MTSLFIIDKNGAIDGIQRYAYSYSIPLGYTQASSRITSINPEEVTSKVRKVLDKPLIVKLTPNVTDITLPAKAAEDAGADGVSLINTLLGMSININTRKPYLANNTGGLSGPAIRPVAVRMVYQVSQAINIPILGMGGIVNGNDAIEFMLAGASAVSIGAGNFIDPYTSVNTVEGIEEYMTKNKIEDINDIVGKVEMN